MTEIMDQILKGLGSGSFTLVIGGLLGAGMFLVYYSIDSLSRIYKPVPVRKPTRPPADQVGPKLTRLGRPIVQVDVKKKPLNALHLIEEIRA